MTLERRALWIHLASAEHMLKPAWASVLSLRELRPRMGSWSPTTSATSTLSSFPPQCPASLWPKSRSAAGLIFGRAGRAGGTIFVDRSSLASATSVAEQIYERLKLPSIPVLLFPEGTSTDGGQVLRFHSRLIDPATSLGVPITTACVRYLLPPGMQERELCWYGDETFADHLWKVLGVTDYVAYVQFGEPRIYTDRRVAADETHDEITVMRKSREVL